MARLTNAFTTKHVHNFLHLLDIEPDDVKAFDYSDGRLVVHRYRRLADGTIKLGPIFPSTYETYYHVYDGE